MVKGPRRATGTIPPPEAVTTPTHDMTNDHPSDTPESGPKKRRFLGAEKKFQIYLEAQSTDKPVGELLRREGLFSTYLARIRQQVKEGALVQGSSLYRISIRFQPMPADLWTAFTQRSAGKVTNLVDLLQGRLSKEILTDVTQRDTGLFPAPSEIKMSGSCLDWAEMCKHVAAVLYGVGARLDHQPELLFQLRGVEVAELVAAATASAAATLPGDAQGSAHPALAGEDLGALFGVELDDGTTAPRSTEPTPRDGLRSPVPDLCDPPPDALPATETDPPAIGEATLRKVQVGNRPRTRKATTTQKTGDRAPRENSTAKRPKTRATTRRAGVQKAPAKKATRATVGRRAKARSKD